MDKEKQLQKLYKQLDALTDNDIDVANKIADTILKLDPIDIRGVTCKLRCFLIQGKFEEGLDLCNKFEHLNDSEIFGWKGGFLYRLGRFEESTTYNNKAIELNPKCAVYYYNLAQALYYIGDTKTAIEKIDKAIALNDENLAIYYSGKAFILTEEGDFNGAIENFNKVIELKSADSNVYRRKGDCLFYKGEPNEAIESYQKAFELEPNDMDLYQIGLCLYELAQYQDALESYDKAIALNPDNDIAYKGKAECLYMFSKFDEAIDNFDKAIKINPCYRNYNDKGWHLYLLGRLEESITCYDEMISLEPDNEEGYTNKCSSLLYLKKFDEALETIKKAIELHLTEPKLQEIKSEILEQMKN